MERGMEEAQIYFQCIIPNSNQRVYFIKSDLFLS